MSSLDWAQVRRALAARPPAQVSDPVASRAAVALILKDGESGIEVLFIRRAEHPLDPWSGQMAFPGGRSEPGDRDLAATAVRETAEEIGLDLAAEGDFLGPLDEVRAMARLRPLDLSITPFVFRLRRSPEMRLSDEVRSVHWIPLAELLSERVRSTYEYEHQGSRLAFPCLRLEDVVIWGLTYRMFMSFQERFPPPPTEAVPVPEGIQP